MYWMKPTRIYYDLYMNLQITNFLNKIITSKFPFDIVVEAA